MYGVYPNFPNNFFIGEVYKPWYIKVFSNYSKNPNYLNNIYIINTYYFKTLYTYIY